MKDEQDRESRLRLRQIAESQNLFARLPSAYAAARRQGEQILKHAGGLSIVEWRVLWDLAKVGPLTIHELATIQRINHSLLSRALPAIQDKGLVKMRRHAEDRRKIVVEMTEEGRKAYDRAAPLMRNRRIATHALFTEQELSDFLCYLDRLEAFLDKPIENVVSTTANAAGKADVAGSD